MTIQLKELREQLAKQIYGWFLDCNGYFGYKWEDIPDNWRGKVDARKKADHFLSLDGLYVEVKGELPVLKRRFRGDYNTGYSHCRQDALKAGYKKVRPTKDLVKEGACLSKI